MYGVRSPLVTIFLEALFLRVPIGLTGVSSLADLTSHEFLISDGVNVSVPVSRAVDVSRRGCMRRSPASPDIAKVYVKGLPEAGSRLMIGIAGSRRGVSSPPAKSSWWWAVKSYGAAGRTISGGSETPAEPNARWGFRRGLRRSGGVGPGSGRSTTRSAIGGSVGTGVCA